MGDVPKWATGTDGKASEGERMILFAGEDCSGDGVAFLLDDILDDFSVIGVTTIASLISDILPTGVFVARKTMREMEDMACVSSPGGQTAFCVFL